MQWKLTLDCSSREPVYLQIANHFEQLIIKGELLPGAFLPPERKLALQLQVNRTTIVNAYDMLRSYGIVYSVRGSGTRVSDHLWEVTPRKIPNWEVYSGAGTFLPNLPIVQLLRDHRSNPEFFNLAEGELSEDLFPTEILDSLLQKMSLQAPLGYTDPRGFEGLRHTLVSHLQEYYGITANPDEILITSGAQQALYLLTQCILNPGDAIAIERPSYFYSLSLFTSAGLRLFPLPMDQEGLQPKQIYDLVQRHKIKMVIINPTYQNPTSITLSESRRKQLLEICEDLRLPIVEDNPYNLLTLSGSDNPPLPLRAISSQSDQVIYIGSLSKIAAPGLRIGWIVAHKLVIKRLSDAKDQMDYGTSVITQQLAKNYLSTGKWMNHLNHINQVLTSRRNTMLQALQTFMKSQVVWTNPKGGYHLWCKTNLNTPDKTILETAIRNKVIFVPGGVFGAEKGSIRLTYSGVQEEQIWEGIKRVAKTIKQL